MPQVTIDVPEALQELASRRGESPEELARRVLTEWLAQVAEDEEDARIARKRWDDLQAGRTTARDWAEVEADLDALDAAEAAAGCQAEG